MYFTCSTLKTTMTVASCEEYRQRKGAKAVQSCKGCTNWERETTDPNNLQTPEQMHAAAMQSISRPVPVRVSMGAEFHRIYMRDR
jgi:hypothetical protein